MRNWLRHLSSFQRKTDTSAVRSPAGRATKHVVQDVKNHYDRLTPTYCSTYGNVIQAYRPSNVEELLIHELEASGLQDGMRILDAGCGVCGPAIWFANQKDLLVEAITISPVQAELAKRAVINSGLEHKIHVQQGDYHEIDRLFPSRIFDRVLFLESLCHAEDYRQVLAGAQKVLKPDGLIYIKDFVALDYHDQPEKQRLLEEGMSFMCKEYSVAFPRRVDLLGVLDELSFQVNSVRAIPMDGDFTAWYAFEDIVGFQWRKNTSVQLVENTEIVASIRNP